MDKYTANPYLVLGPTKRYEGHKVKKINSGEIENGSIQGAVFFDGGRTNTLSPFNHH
jgi:hypothetical protein